MKSLANNTIGRTPGLTAGFFERYALLSIMLLAFVVSLAMLWWSYASGFLVAYSDAASHLNIARRSIDGLTPGIAQLGGVWLPLQHLLMLPFVWSDFLWQTGLAGAIVGMLSFLGINYFIFRIAELVLTNRTGAFLVTLVVLCNPNLLYLQTTSMGEGLFLFLVTASAYFLLRWSLTQSAGSLVLAGIFGLLCTFVRYEGWFFILAELAAVLFVAYRQGGYRRAEGAGLAFAWLAGLGPALWLLWNWAIFGSPLHFLLGEYSARAQQSVFEAGGLLPTAHDFFRSAQYYLYSVGETNGFILGWLTLFLLPVLAWQKRTWPVVFVFLSIAFFEIISLYFGITVLYLPYLFPYDALFNVRYGLFMLPLMALSVAYILSKRQPAFEVGLGVLLIFQIFFLYRELPITLAEPLQVRADSENKQADGGRFLKGAYQGGRILVVPVSNDPFILHTGLPMHEFVTEGNRKYWEEALRRPEDSVEWIVYDAGIDYFTLKDQGSVNFALEHFYRREWSRQGLYVYRRMPPAAGSALSGR